MERNRVIRSEVLLAGALLWVAFTATRLEAMDRWEALSQVESGDNDRAVGAAGEVSRYQIKPRIWRRYAAPSADWKSAENALAVAQTIMRERCADFEASFHRPPTDREFYVLWNAPATIQRPAKVVIARADRFCNLVAAPARKTPAQTER